jgi:ankyrin repeat protein
MALLEKGADVQAKTSNGYTPLHLACLYGYDDIAAMLRAKELSVVQLLHHGPQCEIL